MTRFGLFWLCLIVLLSTFATGCGGGGGGGGGGTTTTTTLTGTGETPSNASNGWSASIRYAIALTSLTAKAVDANGNSLGSGQTLDSAGKFSLSIVPNSEVWVKITNSRGFEIRKFIGNVTGDLDVGAVNASSTVEAILRETGVAATDVYALARVTDALNALYAAPPSLSEGKTVYDALKTQIGSTLFGMRVFGKAVAPDNLSQGWLGAIRAAISLESLTAAAVDENGAALGSGQALDANGAFSLSISPASKVWVKVTNSKGFEIRKFIGSVSDTTDAGTINASSTVETLLKEYDFSASDTFAVNKLTDAINALFSSTPTLSTGQTLYDVFKSRQGPTLSGLKTALAEITANNTALQNSFKLEIIQDALQYFSANFTTTQESLMSTVSKSHFESVTVSRFDRYTIKTFTIDIDSITFTAEDTAEVKVSGPFIATEDSSGSERNITLMGWPIVWKKEGGKWVVYADFPYLQEQLF